MFHPNSMQLNSNGLERHRKLTFMSHVRETICNLTVNVHIHFVMQRKSPFLDHAVPIAAQRSRYDALVRAVHSSTLLTKAGELSREISLKVP